MSLKDDLRFPVYKIDNKAFIIQDRDPARVCWLRANSVGSILDVACGEGLFSKYDLRFKLDDGEVIFPKPAVTSVDIRRVGAKDFVQASAEWLPFREHTFDTVVLSEILEHPVDPIVVLKEAKRVGRVKLIITVPDEESWIKRRIWRWFSIIDSWEHVRLFNADKLRRYFDQAQLGGNCEINHVLFGSLEYYAAQVFLPKT